MIGMSLYPGPSDWSNFNQQCKALGVLYWEPQAYNWKGYSLGAFDNAGKPTVALEAFKN
jgi:hypothetical protein